MKKNYVFLITRGIDGYFIGSVPELPGVFTQAKTIEEIFPRIKEAIEVFLETIDDKEQFLESVKFVGVNQVEVEVG
ncbi:MAG TPA: type II toxin-antitoxin system HicB family antitoxin [Firmicutes bacterium]|nr:type II toxin-antitoxin system HicB family antitoxin [Bacillota bacterium]